MTKPSTITFGKIEESGSFFNPAEAQPPVRFERIEDNQISEEVKAEKPTVKDNPVVEPTLILNDVGLDESSEEEPTPDIEEPTPDIEVETQKVVEAALDDEETDYKELTIQLIKSGQWEKFQPEEGIELEDLDELSKEDFQTISKTQADWKKSEVESKLFEGFSEDEKQFIEFKKNGGDINAYIQSYLYQQQAQNLDIETDNGKKNTVFAYYKSSTKWTDDRIIKHINRLEKDLELESEAQMAKAELEERTRVEHEDLIARQEKLKQETYDKIKDYKSSVRKNLKSKNYEKKRSDAILKALTDIDERGFASIDRAFLDVRNDPDKAELIYNVLLNYDEWIKNVSQDKVNEANLSTFKTIKLNRSTESDRRDVYNRPKKSSKKDLIIELPKKR